MATTIFAPQITLPNEVCDSIEIPRGTQITLSRDVLEQNMLIAIPDDLCDFIQVPHGTQKSRVEIGRIGKKLVHDNFYFMGSTWDKLIFNKDKTFTDDEVAKVSKLFHLRALIKPETYPLTEELCEVLEIPAGTPMNRFDLENQVTEYIRVHKLMNLNHIVNLHNDEKMRKVFALPEGVEEISYNDLVQKIINYFVEKVQIVNTLKGDFNDVAFTISDELADFLKVSHGTKMSLVEAVCGVAKYTYENDLQVWDCKKNSFIVDKNLRNLFSIKRNELFLICENETLGLTYDVLEKLVKKHMVDSA